jgi:UDP-N-acetylglucosamine 3-dehydrogenase
MINCAVIGLGNMGKHHARIYHELSSSNLVAVADIDPSCGEPLTHKFKCRFYADFRTMIERETIDALSIAVPTSMHEEVALLCLKKGIHILLEKPIAATLKEACNISNAADELDLILQIGHIEHFNPAVLKLIEILGQGTLGQLLTVVVRRVGIAPPQIRDSNVIIDLAIHDIELCNFLIRKIPEKIYCRAGTGLLPDREDFADIFLEYNGVNVLIQSNWITPVKIRQMHLTGTKGYAELDFIEQKLSLAETTVEHDYDDFGTFVVKFGQSKMIDIPVVGEEPLKLEIEHFLDCVANKKQPNIDGKGAIEALRVALKAWETSLSKKRLNN